MIAKGNSRSNAKFFARHLLNAQDNERVTVKEIQGFIADNVPDAFKEMEIIAAGSSTKNYMYHLNLSPRPEETLTPEQWTQAVDTAAKELGLENQPRFVIEHEKKGRIHEHVIWLRLDDNLNAISDSWNYQAHDRIREQLERMFDHEPTPPTPEPALRKSREFAEWEQWRGTESGIDPKAMKADITGLFHASDSGAAFQSALEHSGYTLCRGDKQGVLCLVDSHGDSHALLRRIDGLRAAELRAFMADLDPQTLPSVAEAIQLVKAEEENSGGSSAARVLPDEQRRAEPDPRTAPLEQLFPDALPYVADIRERTNQFEAQWFQHLRSLSANDWAQGIDDNERAWQHCFGHSEAARQLDKTTEPPAQDYDPVQPSAHLSGKQPHESWSQFVTRTQPPDRQLTIDTPDEPERER